MEVEGILLKGCRFCPTDGELIEDYLKKKVLGENLLPFTEIFIHDRDVYVTEPWHIFDKLTQDGHINYNLDTSKYGQGNHTDENYGEVRYFFTKLKKISNKSVRSSRTVGTCTWKGQSKGKLIFNDNNMEIGIKKSFSLEETNKNSSSSSHPDSKRRRTNIRWIMHEYTLPDTFPNNNGYVLCKIRKKVSDGGISSCSSSSNTARGGTELTISPVEVVLSAYQQPIQDNQVGLTDAPGLVIQDMTTSSAEEVLSAYQQPIQENKVGLTDAPGLVIQDMTTSPVEEVISAYQQPIQDNQVDLIDAAGIVIEDVTNTGYEMIPMDFDYLDNTNVVVAQEQADNVYNEDPSVWEGMVSDYQMMIPMDFIDLNNNNNVVAKESDDELINGLLRIEHNQYMNDNGVQSDELLRPHEDGLQEETQQQLQHQDGLLEEPQQQQYLNNNAVQSEELLRPHEDGLQEEAQQQLQHQDGLPEEHQQQYLNNNEDNQVGLTYATAIVIEDMTDTAYEIPMDYDYLNNTNVVAQEPADDELMNELSALLGIEHNQYLNYNGVQSGEPSRPHQYGLQEEAQQQQQNQDGLQEEPQQQQQHNQDSGYKFKKRRNING